ncbi:DUF29 family protein [Floridanema evergladense]|uniref:DUF29 family protein n=1 Tax=Floridaenema evergladense BLCC-F167 TaxID=3153639 RepID=A0ABV4WXA6_9CYAN
MDSDNSRTALQDYQPSGRKSQLKTLLTGSDRTSISCHAFKSLIKIAGEQGGRGAGERIRRIFFCFQTIQFKCGTPYQYGLALAVRETPLNYEDFPADCSYDLEQILDLEFFPQ